MDFERYADMLYMQHYVSRKRAQMSLYDRAAQFSPFSALTGHEDAIAETARLTEMQTELDEHRKQLINNRLQVLLSQISCHPEVTVTWFCADEKKAGGTYLETSGKLQKYDEVSKGIIVNQTKILIETICGIESENLKED